MDALDRLRTARAAKEELALARARAEVVPVADVAAGWADVVDAAREAVLGIAAELVSSGIVAPGREADADAVVRRALRSLAQKGAADAA